MISGVVTVVTLPVTRDFPKPKFPIGVRNLATDAIRQLNYAMSAGFCAYSLNVMSVPKAAIDKDDGLYLPYDNVRFPQESTDIKPVTPPLAPQPTAQTISGFVSLALMCDMHLCRCVGESLSDMVLLFCLSRLIFAPRTHA